MNKQQKIAAILAANIGWSESKALEGFSDTQLDSIHNGIKKETPAPGATTNATPTNTPAPATPAAPAPAATVTSNATAPVTLEEWEKTAPPQVVAAFKGIQLANQTEEAQLVDKIVKNESMGFTAEELKGTPIANLRKLAKLADVPVPDPALNGFTPAFVPPTPVANYSGMQPAAPVAGGATKPKGQAPLPRPVMNFRKEEKGKAPANA